MLVKGMKWKWAPVSEGDTIEVTHIGEGDTLEVGSRR